MKKLISLVGTIIILFITFLIIFLTPKNYKIDYQINGYQIKEEYNKKEKHYSFKITKEESQFEFLLDTKYSSSRKIIKQIKEVNNDNIHCILPTITNVNTYPLCLENNESKSFSLIDSKDLNSLYPLNKTNYENKYQNISIYNYFDKTYLLWNYRGFYFINEKEEKNINLFDKDVYDVSLVARVNNYLVIPNYNSNYKFDEVIIIDLNNGKTENWKLDNSINFDSYVLGYHDKSIFIFDRKDKIEYELVPHRKKMRKLSNKDMGKIYLEGWEDISLTKLSNETQEFKHFSLYEYVLKDKKLYLKYRNKDNLTLISNISDPIIISQNQENIYYLKEDSLYTFNPYIGENLLLKNFEWTFNNRNMIFIY